MASGVWAVGLKDYSGLSDLEKKKRKNCNNIPLTELQMGLHAAKSRRELPSER